MKMNMKKLNSLFLIVGLLSTVSVAAERPADPFTDWVGEWLDTFRDYGGDLSLWTDTRPQAVEAPLMATEALDAEWQVDFRDYGGDLSVWTSPRVQERPHANSLPTLSPEACKAEWAYDFRDYGGDISLWTDHCD